MLSAGPANARRTRPRKGHVDARLFELEQIHAAAIAKAQALAADEARPNMREKIQAYLAARGVEPQPTESLFDAWARVLNTSSAELRKRLALRIGAKALR